MFQPLEGRCVLEHSLRTAAELSEGIVLVLPPRLLPPRRTRTSPQETGNLNPLQREGGGVREIVCTPGGATRSESVRCGLSATPAEAEVIVVHDAARPLASASLYAEVVAAVRAGADGAAPAVAVTDTIRHLREGVLDRSELRAVQTPQAFRAQALRDAHADSGEATDDAGLVEAAGGAVWLVEGDPANIKITTAVDLAAAEALLRSGLG